MIGKPWHYKRCYGVIAITRSGLPEPLTILSGAAITIGPVGGSNSRFTRLVMPNLPAPCMYVWLGNSRGEPAECASCGPGECGATSHNSRLLPHGGKQGW